MGKFAEFNYCLQLGEGISEEDLFVPFKIYYKDCSESAYILYHPSTSKSESFVLLAKKDNVEKYSRKNLPKDIKKFLFSLEEEIKKIRDIRKIQFNEIDFEIKNKLITYLINLINDELESEVPNSTQ